MAKDATDREDLLREATGFTRRMEFDLPAVQTTVFCGFRDNGAFSFYWGQETVFQFNTKHELRRAFTDDRLVASYKRQLHWLEPGQGTVRVQMKRIPLSENESTGLLGILAGCLGEIDARLRSKELVINGQVPADADVKSEVLAWLQNRETIQLALHPGVGRA